MPPNKIYQDIERKAKAFRSKHNNNSSGSLHLESLLLQLNVIVSFRAMSEKLSGMAVLLCEENEIYRFMLVNSEQNIGRQNFTICHELYHLFIQENFTFQYCNTGKFDEKKDIEEYKADLFASYLLMPTEGIEERIPYKETETDSISLSTIIKIEQYYQCSRLALLYRLKNLGYISQEKVEKHRLDVKKGANQHGYNTHLYEKGREGLHIGDYGDISRLLFEQEIISEGHYAELMQTINIDVFEEQMTKEEHGK